MRYVERNFQIFWSNHRQNCCDDSAREVWSLTLDSVRSGVGVAEFLVVVEARVHRRDWFHYPNLAVVVASQGKELVNWDFWVASLVPSHLAQAVVLEVEHYHPVNKPFEAEEEQDDDGHVEGDDS